MDPSGFDSGNLKWAEDLAPRTQSVDSFVRLGASADTPENRTLVSQVADLFKKIDIESKEFSFHAPDISDPSKLIQLGRTVRGQDVVRRTAVAMVSPAAYTAAMGGEWGDTTIGFQQTFTPGSKAHSDIIGFLRNEGIAFESPDEVSQFIFMSPTVAQRRGAENTFLDIGHEVTHSVFDLAGADQEELLARQGLTQKASMLQDLSKEIGKSGVPLGDTRGILTHSIPEVTELHQASARRIIAYAEEEVAAQTGALEFGRLAGLSSKIAADPSMGLTGYSTPDRFDEYVSRFYTEGFGPVEEAMRRGYITPDGSTGPKAATYTLDEIAKAGKEWTYRMQDLGASIYSAGMQQADIPEGMYEAIESMTLQAELAGSPGLTSSVKGFQTPARSKNDKFSWCYCRWAKKSVAN
jgi:hypothetical protein